MPLIELVDCVLCDKPIVPGSLCPNGCGTQGKERMLLLTDREADMIEGARLGYREKLAEAEYLAGGA